MTTEAQVGVWPRALALSLAVFWGYFFYGLYDLLVFLQGPDFHQDFHLETGWGLFFLFMVAAPLVAFAVAPSRATPAAAQQLLVAAVAIAVGAALSASPIHLLAVIGLVGTSLLLVLTTHGPRAALTPPRRWHWGLGIFAVVAAGPWFAYALAAAEMARAGIHPSETWGLDHWPVQAALATAIVLVAALAATRPTGWFIAACCAGVCSSWFGVVSWIYPDLDAGLGRTYGAAAAAWGIAFVAVACLTAARETTRRRSGGVAEPGH